MIAVHGHLIPLDIGNLDRELSLIRFYPELHAYFELLHPLELLPGHLMHQIGLAFTIPLLRSKTHFQGGARFFAFDGVFQRRQNVVVAGRSKRNSLFHPYKSKKRA